MKEQNNRDQELDALLSSLRDDDVEQWPASIKGAAGRESADDSGGMPPAADERVARVLDAAVSAAAKRAEKNRHEDKPEEEPGIAGMRPAPANAVRTRRLVGLAAAGVFLAIGAIFYLTSSSPVTPDFAPLSHTGEILMNGRADVRAGRALPNTARLELTARSLLYAGMGERLRLRIAGPAILRYEKRRGRVEIYLERGRLDLRSGGAKIPGFVVVTPRSRIVLKGTMFALTVDAEGESTRLFEGRLTIRDVGGNTVELRRGEKLKFGADDRPERAPLSRDDVRELGRINAALAAVASTTGAGRTAGDAGDAGRPDKRTARSLEDIRALYGFVSEYELADGRRLRGYLVTRDGRSYLHTVKGMIPIRQSDIRSMNLIE